MSLEQTLNDDERLAGLDLHQLEQLVGLVEYDASADPFPVSGWDALVWVVGNAPTALFYLLEMLDAGAPKPALILGFPVGFVGAAESKEALTASAVARARVRSLA